MKLTFRNFERDIERYLDQHGKHTTIGGHPAVRGHDKAQQYVFDAYLEAKGYDAVVDYLLTFNWEVGTNEWLRAATEAFRCARRVSNIKRLWRGVIAKQKLVFWELHAIRAEASISRKQLSAAKKLALCSMGTLRELVIELGDQRERERLNEEIDLFELEERTKVGPPTDLRKVDEGVFWDVIETTRSVSGSVAERINHLTSHLTQDGYTVDSGSPNILWFGDFLGFCNRVNNHLVSRRIHGYRLLDEPIEEFAAAFGFAAVETEGELVQVVVQMFVAHGALMGAQQPALEQ